jgi:hypothetical protein
VLQRVVRLKIEILVRVSGFTINRCLYSTIFTVVEKGVQERDLAVLLELTGKLNVRVNGVEMSSESLYLLFFL